MRFYTSVSQKGKNIYLRGWKDGKRWNDVIAYHPTLYIPTSNPQATGRRVKDVMTGEELAGVDFDSIWDAKEFVKQYEGIPSFKVYGSTDWVGQFINDSFPNEISYDPSQVRVLFFDIEVDSKNGFASVSGAEKEIISVSFAMKGKYYILGLKDFDIPNNRTDVQYHKCSSERELLARFLDVWEKLDPDVVTGWNTNGYDIPYVVNRITNVFGEKETIRLSPWRKPVQLNEAVGKMGRKIIKPYIEGIACLDYLDLYTNGKFVQAQREAYTLDYIASYELGEKKTDYSEYGSLAKLYDNNPQLFLEYNLHDVELVCALDNKLHFLDLVYSLAYDAKVNYQDTLGSVKIWENLIRNHLLKKGMVTSLSRRHEMKTEAIKGAYVKPPKAGKYEWVVSFDASSLYPSLIRQLNISPETLRGTPYNLDMAHIDGHGWEDARKLALENNWTIASNGAAFDKSKKGFLPELMEIFYNKKDSASKEQLNLEKQLQQKGGRDKGLEFQISLLKSKIFAVKVLLNSCFGATSNPYFQFYDNRIAEAITCSGQTLIQAAAKEMNLAIKKILQSERSDFIIASDTDSIIVDCSTLVRKAQWAGVLDPKADVPTTVEFLNKLCDQKLNGMLVDIMKDVVKNTNAYEHAVNMVREAICDKAVWIAGKNYIMRIWNNKGVTYKEPKMKIMGVAAVRSSTPGISRTALKKSIPFILDGDQEGLLSFIEEFKKKFFHADFEDICKSISVRFDAARPTQQIVASNVYNKALRERGLENTYSLINHGAKIRILLLKKPNPVDSEVFGFPDGKLPKEFGLAPYLDLEKMFHNSFMSHLEKMTTPADMVVEKQESLTDFFV